MTSLLLMFVFAVKNLNLLFARSEKSADFEFDNTDQLLTDLAMFLFVVNTFNLHQGSGMARINVTVFIPPMALVAAFLSEARFPGIACDSDMDTTVHSVEHSPNSFKVSFQDG
jgi:hypothetical protein